MSIILPFCIMSSATHIPALYQCGKNGGSIEICELYYLGLNKAEVGLSVFFLFVYLIYNRKHSTVIKEN